jgi:Immunity protein 50
MREVVTTFKARDATVGGEVLGEIPGGADLLAWFGGDLPTFHDAEVLSLELDRKGPTCRMRVHTWEMTGEVDEAGYFALDRHVVVSFELGGVTELNLEGFNHQNVIFGLFIERSGDRYRVELEPCFGLSGTIAAKTVRIALEPGVPPGSKLGTRSSARPLTTDELDRL